MAHAFAGKLLEIDLTSGRIEKRPLDIESVLTYAGCRGYNAKLLWDMVPPGTDPLSPDNVLIFGAGTLTGTSAPTSGRITITCKSPATGRYLKTNVGGHIGPELKFAGYDFLVIKGRSARPVYITIVDDDVRIRDADGIWGKDVRETTTRLVELSGDPETEVACIGPAGENLVLFSCIMCSYYNAAARAGPGR